MSLDLNVEDLYGQDVEFKLTSLILRGLFNAPYVVDVGSEKGSFVQLALSNSATGVVAIEPLPRHLKNLKKLFTGNKKVQVLSCAISNKVGESIFYLATDIKGNELDYHHSLTKIENTKEVLRGKKTLKVKVETLSHLIATNKINKKIDLLKIDTDGHDLQVLEGLSEVTPKVVIVEFWDTLPKTSGTCPYRLVDIQKWANTHGYQRSLVVRRNGALESLEYDTHQSIPGDWGNVFLFHSSVDLSLISGDIDKLIISIHKKSAQKANKDTISLEKKEREIQLLISKVSKGSNQTNYQDKEALLTGLSAKEAVIQELRTAYENAQKTNEELELSRATLIEDISSVKQLLSAAEAKNETGLSAKEAVIQELRTAYENAQKTNEELERRLVLEIENSLQQKVTYQFQEAQLQELHALKEELMLKGRELSFVIDSQNTLESNGLLKATVRALEDKERVINELSSALNAYREAYERLSIFKNRINKLIQLESVKNSLRNFCRPKIGNLYQHEPREINLSSSYYRKRKLTSTPKLSIVTPSFNQGHFIGRTIESILDQNYENLEYIIQDGGSGDSTVSVIQGYDDLHDITWESVKDNGQSHALNLGFNKCSGDVMAWVNSDDVLLPGAIETVISYLNKHPEVDVVYGNRLLIDESDLMIGRWILPGHDDEVLSFADYVPQETMFFRRSIWEASGGKIDENFRFAMDWDLILRFREAGAKFAHIPRYIGSFRIHESQKTSAQINEVGMGEMNLLRERCLGHVPDHTEINKKITPFLIKHKIKHANLTFKEFIRRRL